MSGPHVSSLDSIVCLQCSPPGIAHALSTPSLLRLHRLLFLYMFCWPERGSGLDLLGRRSLRPCRDGARATSPRGPRLHGQRRRADCAASTSASCGARIRMRQSCALAHGAGAADSQLKCDSLDITWLDSLARHSAVPKIANQAGREQNGSNRDRNRDRSRAQPSIEAATGRRLGAMLAGVQLFRDKKQY